MLCRVVASAVIGALLLVSEAAGSLIASEAFEYAPAQAVLLGRNGGVGWSGPWTAGGFNATTSANFTIASGSLAMGQLAVSGNRVNSGPQNGISGAARNFAQAVDASETTVRYLSVVLRPEGTLGAGAFNGFFGLYLDGQGAGGNDAYIGKPGGGAIDRWVLETRGGSSQSVSNIGLVVNQSTLLVLKAQLRPGADALTLYVDPPLGQTEPAVGISKTDLDLGTVTGVVLYSTGQFSVDEIRWGATLSDVLPVPEPQSWLLLTTGAMLLALVRRPSTPRCLWTTPAKRL